MRKRLPAVREGFTHKFEIMHSVQGRIEKAKGYVTVGLYEDGTVGEIFVKMDRQGSQVSGFIDAWAIAVSMLLQTGTSLETIVEKFRNLSFEPAGRTSNPEIWQARSPIDYIVRWLEARFLEKEEDESELTNPGVEVGDLDSGEHLVDVVAAITQETAPLRGTTPGDEGGEAARAAEWSPELESPEDAEQDRELARSGDYPWGQWLPQSLQEDASRGLNSISDQPLEVIDDLIEADKAWVIECDSCDAEEDIRQGKIRWYRANRETLCSDCYQAFGPKRCVRCNVDPGLKLIMRRDGAALLWLCLECDRGYENAFELPYASPDEVEARDAQRSWKGRVR